MMIFMKTSVTQAWQGVNTLGHSFQNWISQARMDIKGWNLTCNLGYVYTEWEKKEISNTPKDILFFI